MQLRFVKQAAMELLYPTRLYCAVCGEMLPPRALHGICDGCCGSLPFIHPPACAGCGKPLQALTVKAGTLSKSSAEAGVQFCVDCSRNPHSFDQGRSVFEYTSGIQRLLYRYKYDGEYSLSATLAWFMADTLERASLGDIHCILPVPLHPNRLRSRGFNQSALLAERIAALTGHRYYEDVMVRILDTPTQTRLSRQGRMENLKGAFAVKGSERIKKRTVLLVDDVHTTGATLDSCSTAIKTAGAARVHVLTLAAGRQG